MGETAGEGALAGAALSFALPHPCSTDNRHWSSGIAAVPPGSLEEDWSRISPFPTPCLLALSVASVRDTRARMRGKQRKRKRHKERVQRGCESAGNWE